MFRTRLSRPGARNVLFAATDIGKQCISELFALRRQRSSIALAQAKAVWHTCERTFSN